MTKQKDGWPLLREILEEVFFGGLAWVMSKAGRIHKQIEKLEE